VSGRGEGERGSKRGERDSEEFNPMSIELLFMRLVEVRAEEGEEGLLFLLLYDFPFD